MIRCHSSLKIANFRLNFVPTFSINYKFPLHYVMCGIYIYISPSLCLPYNCLRWWLSSEEDLATEKWIWDYPCFFITRDLLFILPASSSKLVVFPRIPSNGRLLKAEYCISWKKFQWISPTSMLLYFAMSPMIKIHRARCLPYIKISIPSTTAHFVVALFMRCS